MSFTVGVVKETKNHEYRVGLRPSDVQQLTQRTVTVHVEAGAGQGSGFSDEAYEQAGAKLCTSGKDVFEKSELIVKVKEPQSTEISQLTPQHTVFGYFHFAGSRALTEACLKRGFCALAFETLQGPDNSLPLLTPMSEIAGRLSIQAGARSLEQPQGGSGVLLCGVPGVPPARVVVLGGGVVGRNAAKVAAGFGAQVTVLDVNLNTLRWLENNMPPNVDTCYSGPQELASLTRQADLIIGAVLLPGAAAPKLLRAEHLKAMRPGSVVVDVSIDQGGCVETSHPTTHADPTFVKEGVVHYCVANMPAAVGRTSTHALCNATLPYVLQLATLGTEKFLALGPGYGPTLNMQDGKLTHPELIAAFPDLPA